MKKGVYGVFKLLNISYKGYMENRDIKVEIGKRIEKIIGR